MMTAPQFRTARSALAAVTATLALLLSGWANAAEPSCKAHELQQSGRVGETVQICEMAAPAPAPKPVKKPATCRIVYINGDAVISCPKVTIKA